MKKIFNYILIAISTITVGFATMTLPFRIFNDLSRTEMRIILFAEMVLSLTVFALYFIIKENKEERKLKEEKLKELHNIRVLKREKELEGLNLNNVDLVA